MPITKSAKKALRQSGRRNKMNVRRKKLFRDAVKEFKKAVVAKDFKKAQTLLPTVYKTLDKAAKKNTIPKNTASRKKSRLTQMLSKASKK
ncbi:MAG: 30S ribosomal protein S20 [bacterium]|nr:30S ribosomal protein S20 [bacterium]